MEINDLNSNFPEIHDIAEIDLDVFLDFLASSGSDIESNDYTQENLITTYATSVPSDQKVKKRKCTESAHLSLEQQEEKSNARTKYFKKILVNGLKRDKLKYDWSSGAFTENVKYMFAVPLRMLEILNTAYLPDVGDLLRKVCISDVSHLAIHSGIKLQGVDDIILYWAILLEIYPDVIFTPYHLERTDLNTVQVKYYFHGTRIFKETTRKLLESVLTFLQDSHRGGCFRRTSQLVSTAIADSHVKSFEEGDNDFKASLFFTFKYNSDCKVEAMILEIETIDMSRYAREFFDRQRIEVMDEPALIPMESQSAEEKIDQS